MTKTTVQIPTVDQINAPLEGIARLVAAKGWERSAIVYAFTYKGHQRYRTPKSSSGFPVSLERFARLGFYRLTTTQAVAYYHTVMQEAIDAGHCEAPVPGELFTLPDIPWVGMGIAKLERYGRYEPAYVPNVIDGGKLTWNRNDIVLAQAVEAMQDALRTGVAAGADGLPSEAQLVSMDKNLAAIVHLADRFKVEVLDQVQAS